MNGKNEVIEWLLENENPAVKYRTLTELLGRNQEAEEVYEKIWQSKPILQMLKKQDENGLWEKERKYYGNFTSLRYLTAFAEFGLKKDFRLDRAVFHALSELLKEENEDGFSGCVTPLLLRAIVMLGYIDCTEVQSAIKKYSSLQLKDGGFICKRLLDKKPERKSCYKASLAALLMYSECKKNGFIPDGTEELIKYFTKRDVFYSSDKTKLLAEGRFGWRYVDNFFPVEPMRIGLPLILAALSSFNVKIPAAMQFLYSKESENGKFYLDGTLSKQPCSFGKKETYNKWITFYAALAEGEKSYV